MKTLTGVLALGQKIADEIGAVEERNTTGKWIAHHLAGKLEEAKSDPLLVDECSDLILKLWQSRQTWPSGDPLTKYEALLPYLHMLLRAEGRFFTGVVKESKPVEESTRLLQIAADIDNLSSALIRELIKEAVQKTGILDDDWLADETEVGGDPQIDFLTTVKIWAADGPPDIETKLLQLREFLNNKI